MNVINNLDFKDDLSNVKEYLDNKLESNNLKFIFELACKEDENQFFEKLAKCQVQVLMSRVSF